MYTPHANPLHPHSCVGGQHFDKLGDFPRALQLIQEAVDLMPSVIELHMFKARVLKHLGQLGNAADALDAARVTDLADRYINTSVFPAQSLSFMLFPAHFRPLLPFSCVRCLVQLLSLLCACVWRLLLKDTLSVLKFLLRFPAFHCPETNPRTTGNAPSTNSVQAESRTPPPRSCCSERCVYCTVWRRDVMRRDVMRRDVMRCDFARRLLSDDVRVPCVPYASCECSSRVFWMNCACVLD